MESNNEVDHSIHRFSTDDLPERDRLTHWREVCGRTMMKVDMSPLGDAPFRCTAELQQLPDLGIASIMTTPNRLNRSHDLIADGNDDFIFVIPTVGHAEITKRKQGVNLAAHSALLVPSDEPSSTVVTSLSQFISLAIPATVLISSVAGMDAALMPVIPDKTEAMRLLVSYLGCLRDDTMLFAPETRRLVANHIHDLVALAVGATRDAAEVSYGRGVPAARLRAIKAVIAANLGRQDLSLGMVALNQRVTPRYVQKLFESEGKSFSEFVLDLRLTRARSMLEAPHYLERKISDIAFDCGFSDVSYFNRTFRRRYAMTPTDVRQQAQSRER